jgi:hypothetical protein
MKLKILTLGALAALSMAGAASAHHAFNMYDNSKYENLTGTVQNFSWKNPHAMIDFVADTPAGPKMWSVELSAPNIIGRRGWSAKSLKAGDKIPLVVHPMKDGSAYGLLVSATLPNGQVLKDKN